MAEYTLHCFAQSGNAYKAALALELAGADWAPEFVDFFNGEARSPEFAAKNIMAEVPVLDHHTDSGDVRLTQTGVILDYLSGTLDKYAASDPREALRWILFDNHKLTANMATWRFLVNFAPEKVRNPDVIGFLKGRALAAMKVLNTIWTAATGSWAMRCPPPISAASAICTTRRVRILSTPTCDRMGLPTPIPQHREDASGAVARPDIAALPLLPGHGSTPMT